jgi:DNA-binding YbaB/EbfC family protein
MKNLGQMMKQAQEMQSKMQAMQEELADAQLEGQAGGGMVTVTMDGTGAIKQVKIDPKLVDPEDVEMLEDLILAAANDAKAKVESYAAEKMKEVTGGLQLPPGMSLPF